jgi:hypothetical protein
MNRFNDIVADRDNSRGTRHFQARIILGILILDNNVLIFDQDRTGHHGIKPNSAPDDRGTRDEYFPTRAFYIYTRQRIVRYRDTARGDIGQRVKVDIQPGFFDLIIRKG